MSDSELDHELRLQRYLNGQLSPKEARLLEQEILGSEERSEELIDELSLRELIDLRRRTKNPRVARIRTWGPSRWSLSFAAVAAVVALFFFLPRSEELQSPTFRGGDSGAIVALEPLGDLAALPSRFLWRAAPGARSYTLEIFDPSGHRVLVESVADTSYAIPPDRSLPSSGFWQLTPIDEAGIPGERSKPFRFRMNR